MAIDPIALTRQLVDIESTTYHEGRCGAFLHHYLQGLGYDVEKQPVPQPDMALTPGGGTGDRFNLYATMPGTAPQITLSTHFDTVPPYFGSSEDDTYVYGRGSCDAKGILASQVAAAEKLHKGGLPVGLLYVVGEERDSAGAKVANLDGHGSRFLINGEPTENKLALATKGALRVELRAHGRMAHSAYPELGDSAIEKLVHVLHDLLAAELPVDPEIGPSTLNIGILSGGRAPNVIPDAAEAHLLIRLIGPSQEVKTVVERVVAGRVDVAYSLDLHTVRMKRMPGWETMIAKYATDISSLTSWGEPMLLGPGTIHVAHTDAEKVLKAELVEAVEKYAELVGSLATQL
ncbi:MAG: M20/M25/M40 family metallo-hydrolase [Janthinobacterium lividum]